MAMLNLFLAFLLVGLFAFGGGYSALPIIENLVVKKYSFLTISEFWKIVGIAQITPGPIALNIATFVGAQKAKVFGAIISTFAVILFPSLLSFLLIIIYNKASNNSIVTNIFESFQKMIPVLICLSLISLFLNVASELKYIPIIIVSFILVFVFPKFSILLKIIISGFISILLYSFIIK